MIDLYNDDCLKVMATLPDESVDLIVTDPPYRTISGGTKRQSNLHPSAMVFTLHLGICI